MSLQSTNWQSLINDAVARNDFTSAAVFEQQRNAKIDSPDYKGAQQKTYNFADYLNAGANAISTLRDTAEYNNAWSASQAQIQREWQVQQNAQAMAFNQQEAAKNRDWQQMMSNTAHQREVADLKAAGLNPVLSVMGGNGAAVTSGATASGVTSSGAKGETDMSVNSAMVNLLGSIYNRQTQLEAANINARTQEAVAEKYTAMNRLVAEIAAGASMYAADRSKYGTAERLLETVLGLFVGNGDEPSTDTSSNSGRSASEIQRNLQTGMDSLKKGLNPLDPQNWLGVLKSLLTPGGETMRYFNEKYR